MNFIAGEILGGCGDAKAAPPIAWQFCRAVSFRLGEGTDNGDKGVEWRMTIGESEGIITKAKLSF